MNPQKEIQYTESASKDIQLVAKIVAEESGIQLSEILKKSRKRDIVTPRQIAHSLAYKYTKSSLHMIGALIGFKDHATVIHSRKAIENLIESKNKPVIELYERCKRKIEILFPVNIDSAFLNNAINMPQLGARYKYDD